jgi:hypothetical protein
MVHLLDNDRMISMALAAKGWLSDIASRSSRPWAKLFAAVSDGRFRRWIVQADRTKLVTGEVTRLRPYIARSAPRSAEISLAQNVQVSSGYKFAARRSSLIYGRNKLRMRQYTV